MSPERRAFFGEMGRRGQHRPREPIPFVPVVDIDAAEIRSAAVMAAQSDHAAALDERRPRLDVLARHAHTRGEALLFTGGSGFEGVAVSPGDDLPTWPEVRP